MSGGGTVQSVARALAILQRLSRCDSGLRLSELSRDMGLPTSTAHRLLVTLEAEGFARFERKGALWRPGEALRAMPGDAD